MFKKRERSEKNKKREGENEKKEPEDNCERDDIEANVSEIKKKAKMESSLNYHTTDSQAKESRNFFEKESKELKFQAKTQLAGQIIEGEATRSLDIDIEQDKDAFEIAKKNIQISQDVADGKLSTNVYRGENGYANYMKLTEDDLRNQRVRGTLGPLRAPTNVRSTVRVDYQKYLCKDYNEKGYCGYGDGCVFLHDRYDYKPGWLIDMEYDKQIKQEQRKKQGGKVEEEPDYEIHEEEEEESNHNCGICHQVPVKPIITECEHIFCESCALRHYGKSDKCFLCKKDTHGIFNLIEEEKNKENQNEEKKEESDIKKRAENSEKLGVLFKEYKKQKEDIKKKTLDPIGGWVIP